MLDKRGIEWNCEMFHVEPGLGMIDDIEYQVSPCRSVMHCGPTGLFSPFHVKRGSSLHPPSPFHPIP